MVTHHGQIVEKVIRRDGHSISDLSRIMKVNRRSIYNWFNQPQLRPEIIYRIGCIIKHDFSIELPQIFNSEDFKFGVEQLEREDTSKCDISVKDDNYWKEKYNELLKSYNLLKQDQMFIAI